MHFSYLMLLSIVNIWHLLLSTLYMHHRSYPSIILLNKRALPVVSGQRFLWVRRVAAGDASHPGRPGTAACWPGQRKNQHMCGGEPHCWSSEAQTEAATEEQWKLGLQNNTARQHVYKCMSHFYVFLVCFAILRLPRVIEGTHKYVHRWSSLTSLPESPPFHVVMASSSRSMSRTQT